MMEIGDHPLIANALRTGYPHGEPEYPICPVCGEECEEIYMNQDREIFGCDGCVKTQNAWITEKCFMEG